MATFSIPPKKAKGTQESPLGRIKVYESDRHLCEEVNFVDITSSGYLVAANTELAALKAFICAEPLISKESDPKAFSHSLENMGIGKGLGYYDLRERVGAVKRRLSRMLAHTADPAKINDSPLTNITMNEPPSFGGSFNYKDCPACEPIATKLAESVLLQKLSEMGIEEYNRTLPLLVAGINQTIFNMEEYQRCLYENAERLDGTSPKKSSGLETSPPDNIPEGAARLLQGASPYSPQYQRIQESSAYKSALKEWSSEPKPIASHLSVCDPSQFESEMDYYTCLATSVYFKVEDPRGEIPEINSAMSPQEKYAAILEAYSPTSPREYGDCLECNNYLFAIVVFKEGLISSEVPAQIWALVTRAKAPLSERKTTGFKSTEVWADSDLVLPLTHTEWLQLSPENRLQFEQFVSYMSWIERPIYQDHVTLKGESIRTTAYQICKESTCGSDCEPCRSLYRAEDPQRKEYLDCVVSNCLFSPCKDTAPCNSFSRDFGVDSPQWRDCYISNVFDPCKPCRATLETFGRASQEYYNCVLNNVPPIGPNSEAQWAVNLTSEEYPRSYVKDIVSGQEQCIQCCNINPQTDLNRYLECVAQHCNNQVLEYLCPSEDSVSAETLEQLSATLSPTVAETLEQSPFTEMPLWDMRLIAAIREREDVKVLQTNVLALVDGKSYYQDLLELVPSGKLVTKRVRIYSEAEALAAITAEKGQEWVDSATPEKLGNAVKEYQFNAQDIHFLLKDPESVEQVTTQGFFRTKCALLEALRNSSLKKVLKGDCLEWEDLYFKNTLCREGACYRHKVLYKITGESTSSLICNEIPEFWDRTELEGYKILSEIPSEAIERLARIDPTIQDISTRLQLHPLDSEELARRLILGNPELAERLKEVGDNFSAADVFRMVRQAASLPEVLEGAEVLKSQKVVSVVNSQELSLPELVHISLPITNSQILESSTEPFVGIMQASEAILEKVRENLKRQEWAANLSSREYLESISLTLSLPTTLLGEVSTPEVSPLELKGALLAVSSNSPTQIAILDRFEQIYLNTSFWSLPYASIGIGIDLSKLLATSVLDESAKNFAAKLTSLKLYEVRADVQTTEVDGKVVYQIIRG